MGIYCVSVGNLMILKCEQSHFRAVAVAFAIWTVLHNKLKAIDRKQHSHDCCVPLLKCDLKCIEMHRNNDCLFFSFKMLQRFNLKTDKSSLHMELDWMHQNTWNHFIKSCNRRQFVNCLINFLSKLVDACHSKCSQFG